MFGTGQFETVPAGFGLDALAHAAGAAPDLAASPNATPDGGTAPAQEAGPQPAVPPSGEQEVGEIAKAIEGGPLLKDLDKKKLMAARGISSTNQPKSLKLTGWKPLETKPTKSELWQVIMERDPKLTPKNWKVEKMVAKLCEYDAGIAGSTEGEEPPAPAVQRNGPAPVPDATQSQQNETEGQASKSRWSRNKFVRVIHIICSDNAKEDFINRDRKLDRQEMDAKGTDAFWEKTTAANTISRAAILP